MSLKKKLHCCLSAQCLTDPHHQTRLQGDPGGQCLDLPQILESTARVSILLLSWRSPVPTVDLPTTDLFMGVTTRSQIIPHQSSRLKKWPLSALPTLPQPRQSTCSRVQTRSTPVPWLSSANLSHLSPVRTPRTALPPQ